MKCGNVAPVNSRAILSQKNQTSRITGQAKPRDIQAMAERPRELADFKKARLNGGTDNHSLKDSHRCLRCR